MPPVERAAVVVHSRKDVSAALDCVRTVAERSGVELLFDGTGAPDIALVLGGDGTMLRGLARFLASGDRQRFALAPPARQCLAASAP